MSGPILLAGEPKPAQGQTITIDEATLQQLVARAAAAAGVLPSTVHAAPATAPAAWGALAAARPAEPPPPVAVAIPIKIDLGDRANVKAFLFFGGEHAGPGALQQLLDSLLAAHVPVDVWRPKEDDGDRGGYGRRRGGWR